MRLLALQTVLVATDLEANSVPALETARRLAAAAGAALHVVHVVVDRVDAAHERRTASQADVEAAVGELLRDAGLGPLEAQFHTATGDATHGILLLADRITASVIVLGRHRERPVTPEHRGIGGAPCLPSSRIRLCPVSSFETAFVCPPSASLSLSTYRKPRVARSSSPCRGRRRCARHVTTQSLRH